MIGQTISHYKILEKLGEGGMGVVYKAEDTKLKRTVALKFLPSKVLGSGTQRARFIHEAQAAAALDHPNICTVHEIDTVDDHTFIAMAYVEGESLESKVEKGPLKLEDCVEYATEICDALGEAHSKNAIHRDIKPANVMISVKGRAILMDFGLAKLADRTQLTQEDTTLGTVNYMSPEQTRGDDVDHRTDIWSAGVVLFQMISGHLPFRGDHPTAVAYSIVNEDPEPLTTLRTGVPMELERMVSKMLAKSPDERYQHVDEILADLKKIKRELGTRRRVTRTGTTADKPRKRRTTKFTVPSILVLLLVAGYFLLRPMLFDELLISAPKPIAVITFENQTGDGRYDYLREVIPNLLITKLEQSKHLSVVSWERMRDLLEQSGRGDQELIDRETGFEVCSLDGIDTIVLGSFSMAGDVFVTDVKVLDVHSKELLKTASAKGEGVGSILANQVDELGRQISKGVGLSDRSIAASGQPVAQVTTRSMDAYHYFLRGRDEFQDRYPASARRSLEKAVELDSTFAVAWLYLGRACHALRDYNSGNYALAKARKLAASAPEKDRLYIEAMYANIIERDDLKYLQLLSELVQKFPNEKLAHQSMGMHYSDQDDFGKAIESYEKALSLDPEFGEALNSMAYLYARLEDYSTAIEYLERYAAVSPGETNPIDSMAEMYFRLGKLDKAVELYKKTLEIRPDIGAEVRIAYIAALEEDYSGAIEWCNRFIDAAPSPGLAGTGRNVQAFYYLMAGREDEAIGAAESAREVFEHVGHTFAISGTWFFEGLARYQKGEYERARQCYERSVPLLKKTQRLDSVMRALVAFVLGLLDLRENRIDAAKERLAEIEAARPEIADSNPNHLPIVMNQCLLLESEILLADGRVDDAIEVCKTRPDVGIPLMLPLDMFFYNLPLERDVLARAYVAKGDLDAAIAEYERLVTFDPSSRNRQLIYPVFRYRLGLLYEQKGLGEKAATQYEKFLDTARGAGSVAAEATDARRRLSVLIQKSR